MILAARDLGFDARKEYATLDDLRQYLTTNVFPILFINLLVIDGYNTTHAIILEEISEEEIKILDPRIGSRTIDLEIFEYSWQRAKNVAIIVLNLNFQAYRRRGDTIKFQRYRAFEFGVLAFVNDTYAAATIFFKSILQFYV